MTLKKNRHGPWTRGLAITNHSNDQRFCFFEIDNPFNPLIFYEIIDTYRRFGLDLCIHRSGHGIHFLSPTLVSKEVWKGFHVTLKHINPKCPMTTLRIHANKYPDEAAIWFSGIQCHYFNYDRRNSIELSQLINKWFESQFTRDIHTDLKFVRYPLP